MTMGIPMDMLILIPTGTLMITGIPMITIITTMAATCISAPARRGSM